MDRICWAMDGRGLVHAFNSQVMRNRWVMEHPSWGAQAIPARTASMITGGNTMTWLRVHPNCNHMRVKHHLSL